MTAQKIPVVAAAVISFGITGLLGFWLVPFMRRLKYGQTILDIGPKWHKNKQGIPTMGGVMFIIGIVGAVLGGYPLLARTDNELGLLLLEHSRLVLGLLMALAFGVIGFADDYIKVVKKRNLGLSAPQKMVMQFFVAILYMAGLYMAGDRSTIVFVPFFGQLNLYLLYYPLAVLGIVYLVNVVNITDGIDGLCASATFVTALGFLVIASVLQVQTMEMLAAALAGGCLGFLLWNLYPARIFMGDTGSMFLGGMVVALAFGLGIPVFLLFMGILYILEGLSVMVQTAYFKYTRRKTGTGKRLFKMSPVHHHFEMSGWGETAIVVVFSLVQLLGCAIAVAAVMRI